MQLFNWLKNSLQLQNESLFLRDISSSMQGDLAYILFPEIGIFQRANLDLGGWVDSFSRSVHLDRSTEADSGKYTIRQPAPTSPHNLSSKDATSEKQCQGSRRPSHKGRPSHLWQCERVTSDGLTVGLLPNWLSVKERRAIRSPLKYVSPHQTMLF